MLLTREFKSDFFYILVVDSYVNIEEMDIAEKDIVN